LDARSKANLRGLIPVYPDDSSVQYFSITHKCWLNARMHLTTHADELGVRRICYNIHPAFQSMKRTNVPLDMLQHPLAVGDKVEVCINSGSGGVWAPGVVVGQTTIPKIAPNYRVQLLDEMLVRVPAVQVRRHFSPGDSVEIYSGSFQGWVPGTAQEKSGKARCPEPVSKNSPQPDGMHPWVMVPVVEEMQCHNPVREDVPLYLLRKSCVVPEEQGKEVRKQSLWAFNLGKTAMFTGAAVFKM